VPAPASAGAGELEAPNYNCKAPCLIYNGGLGAEPPAGSRAESLVRGKEGEAPPLKLRAFSIGMPYESGKICRIDCRPI